MPLNRRLAIAAVATCIIAASCGPIRLRRYRVADHSMSPALRAGDYIICRTTRRPQRGDIIVYPDPATPSRELLKRVIGVAGDTVEIRSGVLLVNGHSYQPDDSAFARHWRIASGTVFTVGDNAARSIGDSRTTGPVKTEGSQTVVGRYWPWRPC